MSTWEDREFELEKLRVELEHQEVWASFTLLIAVEFAVFTSIAATYLSYGLTSGDVYYILVAAFSILALYPIIIGTTRYFRGKKMMTHLNENVEREIQSIRDRFIAKRTEQEDAEGESVRTSSEERRRDKLIYDIIVARYEQEWKRTNDLDAKANNVMGFAGLLATLTGGIITGIAEFLPQLHLKYLFLIPLVLFIASAFFGLLAYWMRDFGGIRPDALIHEYSSKTETELLRSYAATVCMLTLNNFEYNKGKVKWLNIAFSLLVLAIGLFFVIALVNMLV